jgi:cellular nucleic acid-binding protein
MRLSRDMGLTASSCEEDTRADVCANARVHRRLRSRPRTANPTPSHPLLPLSPSLTFSPPPSPPFTIPTNSATDTNLTVGHIAENCQSPARLCYNCREAGHESTNCPHPRTTDGKQCYACGGVGHVKADCPSLRSALGGRFGFHGAHGAPRPVGGAGPGPGPGVGAGPGAGPAHLPKCYQCGRPGHIARMCPAAGRPRGAFAPTFRPRTANPDGTPVKC